MAFSKCIVCPFKCSKISLCGKFISKSVRLSLRRMEELGFYHVFPGYSATFVETFGCNLGCKDCLYPEIFFKGAFEEKNRIEGDIIVLSCNSGKNYELLNIIEAKEGIGLITHGFLSEEVLREYIRVIDFFLVTFFGFSERSYAHLTISRRALNYAKNAVEMIVNSGKFVEIRYIIVENVNDKKNELEAFFNWISEIDGSIPVHIKRFFSMNSSRAPTRNEKLFLAYRIAKESGLKYVYIDDLFRHKAKNTYYDGEIVIERVGDEINVLRPELLHNIPLFGKVRIVRGLQFYEESIKND